MKNNIKRQAIIFLILLGVISMLSDFTHEGARSIYGPFLGLIGISAFMISLTAGLGEFIGQSLRIITGFIADKTKKYWTMMIIGYSINLLVIPLLMFVDASIFYVAIILILLERVGKGIRAPAKSALTSFVAPHLGAGKSFAFQEALDQFGAFLGPIFVYIVLSLNQGSLLNGYQLAFGLLGIFAILTIVMLIISRFKYPHPDLFEEYKERKPLSKNLSLKIYLVAVMFIAFSFMDFPLLSFHITKIDNFNVIHIPLLYALAMGVDAIAALIFGYIFDKKGVLSLILAMIISLLFAPLFFLTNSLTFIILGVIIWGIAMGAQESILKAVIQTLVDKERRATAYGLFYAIFGAAWFIGSLILGILYEINYQYLIIYIVSMQLISILFLIIYIKINQKGLNKT